MIGEQSGPGAGRTDFEPTCGPCVERVPHAVHERVPAAICTDCYHEAHPLRRCGVIVGSGGGPMPEPDYCPCADAGAMEYEIQRLTAASVREPKPDGWHAYHVCGGRLREIVWTHTDDDPGFALCVHCGDTCTMRVVREATHL